MPNSIVPVRFRTLGLVAVLVIFGFQNFGYQNIPMSMSGEILPVETKVAAMRYVEKSKATISCGVNFFNDYI